MNAAALVLRLEGLTGGHSGAEIHKGRANGIVTMATLLEKLCREKIRFRIADFSGGQAKNAIPNNAQAVLTVKREDLPRVREAGIRFEAEFRAAYQGIEPTARLIIMPTECPSRVWELQAIHELLRLLLCLPDGVRGMSPFVQNLVETSANLGVLSSGQERLTLTEFIRSSNAYRAKQLGNICCILAEQNGFFCQQEGHAPGWAVNPDSKLAQTACRIYHDLMGEEMTVEPIHAGLECGVFAKKNPALDIISIGPTLTKVHTPQESCRIEDIERMARLMSALLAELSAAENKKAT